MPRVGLLSQPRRARGRRVDARWVDAVFTCPAAGPGDLGSPELEAAVQEFNEAAARLAQAMGEAIQAAGANAAAAAVAYVVTEAGAMPRGR